VRRSTNIRSASLKLHRANGLWWQTLCAIAAFFLCDPCLRANAQELAGTEACIPGQLQPPKGALARLKLIGTDDPTVIRTYVSGLTALFCPPVDASNGWNLIGQAALAGYRPAIRLISAQVPETPDIILGQEEDFFTSILAEAKRGATSAGNAAAFMMLNSLGTSYNPEGAAEWFARNARTGNQRAIENLAFMRATGLGTGKESENARRLAASLPAQKATRVVARIIVALAGGAITDPDPAAIDDWVTAFSPRLKDLRSRLQMEFQDAIEAHRGSPREKLLVEKGAEFGVTEAMVDQAEVLLQKADEPEVEQAISLLHDAAVAGDSRAPGVLARIAAASDLGADLPLRALGAVRAASDAGNANAMIAYGNLLYFPNYGAPSLNLGAQWIGEAARAGSPEAQVRYAVLLLLGIGAEPDPDAARDWLRKAAAANYKLGSVMLRQIGENSGGNVTDETKVTSEIPVSTDVVQDAAAAPDEGQNQGAKQN
jgi:TPR repeat protein